MNTYFEEAKEHREIREFHYGKEYSLTEVSEKLGFGRGERRNLFYKVLIENGILLHDHSPSYLAFISDYITFTPGEKQRVVVTYPGTIMIGDLLESHNLIPVDRSTHI